MTLKEEWLFLAQRLQTSFKMDFEKDLNGKTIVELRKMLETEMSKI